jgi:hypothetical protein
MAVTYFPGTRFPVDPARARKNRADTCCASRSNATLVAIIICVKLGSRWFDFLVMIEVSTLQKLNIRLPAGVR